MDMNASSKAIDTLIILGIGVFVLLLILAIIFGGFATAKQSVNQTAGQFGVNQIVTISANTVNSIATANTLTLTLSNGGWVSQGNPLTITVSGNVVKTVATNTLYAVPGPISTNSFTITSYTGPTVLSNAPNFYNITTVTLSGVPASASPIVIGTVVQSGFSVVHGSSPSANTVNTITAYSVANVLLGPGYGYYSNFSSVGGTVSNAYGNPIPLAIFALVFVVIILAILAVVRSKRGGGDGSLLK